MLYSFIETSSRYPKHETPTRHLITYVNETYHTIYELGIWPNRFLRKIKLYFTAVVFFSVIL